MARPIKQGIEYFPLDVFWDDNVKLFKAEHGLSGIGFLVSLYQKIYSQGYFIKWDNDIALLFSQEINVNINKVNDYINSCFRRQLLNKCLHEKYRILTSRGIQNRYIEATLRRTEINFISEYLLIEDADKIYERYNKPNEKRKVIVNIYSVNADNNSINADILKSPHTPLDIKLNNIKLNRESNAPAHTHERSFKPPNLEEVLDFAKQKGISSELVNKFMDYYETSGWKDSKGQQVLNWQSKFIWWRNNEPKPSERSGRANEIKSASRNYTAEELNAMSDRVRPEDI